MGVSIQQHLFSLPVPVIFHQNRENKEIGIYFFPFFVYDKHEQSRRPRVKCCQYGELSDRRRIVSAMRYPHPLHIMETSFMESDTRSGIWPASLRCFIPPVKY